jgi:hypothetical protein
MYSVYIARIESYQIFLAKKKEIVWKEVLCRMGMLPAAVAQW